MAKGIYQRAFEAVVSSEEWSQDKSRGIDALLTMAYECDRLRNNIIESARGAAWDLERIAQSFERGRVHLENPMGSSRLYDIPVTVGQLRATHDALQSTANAVLGIERGTQFKAEILKGFEPTYEFEGKATTLEAFFATNLDSLTNDEVRAVKVLAPGQEIKFGGGASAEVVLKRIS